MAKTWTKRKQWRFSRRFFPPVTVRGMRTVATLNQHKLPWAKCQVALSAWTLLKIAAIMTIGSHRSTMTKPWLKEIRGHMGKNLFSLCVYRRASLHKLTCLSGQKEKAREITSLSYCACQMTWKRVWKVKMLANNHVTMHGFANTQTEPIYRILIERHFTLFYA